MIMTMLTVMMMTVMLMVMMVKMMMMPVTMMTSKIIRISIKKSKKTDLDLAALKVASDIIVSVNPHDWASSNS